MVHFQHLLARLSVFAEAVQRHRRSSLKCLIKLSRRYIFDHIVVNFRLVLQVQERLLVLNTHEGRPQVILVLSLVLIVERYERVEGLGLLRAELHGRQPTLLQRQVQLDQVTAIKKDLG